MQTFYTAGSGAAFRAISNAHGVAGVMVSIVAFQAVDPGSIPGPRSLFDEAEWTGGSTVWRACLA